MPRILLVEGHAPTREYLARSLSDAGHEVVDAADAARAWELFAAGPAEAVVLAAELPEAAELIRRGREAAPRVLVVVADKAHLGKALGKSAVIPLKPNAYVADPTERELTERLAKLFAQSAPAPVRPRLRGVDLALSRAPGAAGEVAPGVVARLLHQVWRGLSDGVLVLDGGGPERRILFQRGAPVAFESDDPAESLPRSLVDAGRMDQAALQATLEAMATGLSPGAALIAAGVLEPGEPVQAALRAYLQSAVARCVGLKEGRWRFHPGEGLVARAAAAEILPLQTLLEGARAGLPLKHFADALKAVGEAYPVRTGDFPQIVPAAALGSADLRAALALDGRTRTREFLEARRAQLQEALSLLWFLSLVGAVEFQTSAEPATPLSGDGRTAPRRRKPLPPDRAEALRQGALRILPGTYFHALGVDIAAPQEEVDRAYQEVSSRFHPDGFAEYEVADLADLLASVQDKLAAAHKVLSNPEKRRAYLAFLLSRLDASGARRGEVDVDAEVALRRGERALRARHNAEAVEALRDAVARNPREPEYLALLAFAELHDPAQPREERIAAARRTARKTLALDPGHVRATVVLALAEEASGDLAAARALVLGLLRAHPERELAKQVLHWLNRPRG